MSPADPLPVLARPVLLRRLRTSDLTVFQVYRTDPELARYQGWSAMPDGEALAFIEEMSVAPLLKPGAWSQIAIADPDTDLLIGDLGLFLGRDSSYAEIGFTISSDAQGRGIGTAAARAAIAMIFAYTRAARVLGITDSRNTASVRVLERAGMRRIESREVVFKGEPCVEWVFASER